MTTSAVMVGSKRVRLEPRRALGKGGEADVYRLGRDRAVKVYKGPDHPDLAGAPHEQDAARRRLKVAGEKLRAFPASMPSGVVGPDELALDPDTGAVVGFAMSRVRDPRPLATLAGVAAAPEGSMLASRDALLGLAQILTGVHRAGAVVGDLNDQNVLVSEGRPWLIDADSFAYGPYPCPVFTDRFTDPRLTEVRDGALHLVRRRDPDSDWYAFAALTLRALLGVGPHGGVHRPPSGSAKVPQYRRAHEGITVFHPQVRYPRPARPLTCLPAPLLDHLREVFEGGRRGPFPTRLLEALAPTRCRDCGLEHGRRACPTCGPARSAGPGKSPAPPRTAPGQLAVFPATAWPATAAPRVWLEAGVLYRQRAGALGPQPERIGAVLEGQTRWWAGPELGFGFYRAGALSVAFVFDPRRGGLNDRAALPLGPEAILEASCAISGPRAWLFLRVAEGGRRQDRCLVYDATGRLLASAAADAEGESWLASGAGAVAVGGALLAPTDAGLVRVEVDGGALTQARAFPETAPHIDAGTRLAVGPDGLYAARGERIVRLVLAPASATKGGRP